MEFNSWSLKRTCLSRHDQKLATFGALLRENDIKTSIRFPGVRSCCRSRKQRATWPSCRSKSHQCKGVADWLRFFYATCWLACFFALNIQVEWNSMILYNDLLVLCTIIPASILFIISLVLYIIPFSRFHHWVPIFFRRRLGIQQWDISVFSE